MEGRRPQNLLGRNVCGATEFGAKLCGELGEGAEHSLRMGGIGWGGGGLGCGLSESGV